MVIGLLMLTISAASMAFRVAQLGAEPLASWAEAERHVTATGVLISDPTFVDVPGFGGAQARQVRVEVRVEQLVAGNERADLRTPVLVLGDGAGWSLLRLGDTVEVTGSLAPTRHIEPVGRRAVQQRGTEPRLTGTPGIAWCRGNALRTA